MSFWAHYWLSTCIAAVLVLCFALWLNHKEKDRV